MKNIFLTLILLSFFDVSCKAQHIIPIENTHNYIGSNAGYMGNHDYVYVKDINSILPKFLGTWKGHMGSSTFEFVISKRTTDDGELKQDELLMRYKITDVNSNVIENTLSLPNDSPFVLKNGYIAETGSYVFSYIGRNNKCGQNGWVFFNQTKNTTNKAKLFLSVQGESYPICDTGPAEQILPLDWIELTKQ